MLSQKNSEVKIKCDICLYVLVNRQTCHSLLFQSGFDTTKEFVRGDDILDIWFDSGSSWATVLKGWQSLRLHLFNVVVGLTVVVIVKPFFIEITKGHFHCFSV